MNSSSELEKAAENSIDKEAFSASEQTAEVSQEQIAADYLSSHPDFFEHHSALLTSMEIAHSSGSAVSLIERQVALLRGQNAQHKKQLSELVEIATENEQSNQRMHKLTLSLIGCEGIDACEVALDEILCDEFSVDATALKLFVDPVDEQPEHLFVSTETTLGQELDKLLNTRKPMCGFFKQLPLEALFDEKSASISSVAVLPLYVEKNNCFGALVLGSQNVRRFNADMGTLFLERLSEILSHKLDVCIRNK
ncbi:MAG: DUF484 family protein [Gammaproteobacteria bacterium]|nr:DUF484 family protein [Gammaproteobacteria bacterium]